MIFENIKPKPKPEPEPEKPIPENVASSLERAGEKVFIQILQ